MRERAIWHRRNSHYVKSGSQTGYEHFDGLADIGSRSWISRRACRPTICLQRVFKLVVWVTIQRAGPDAHAFDHNWVLGFAELSHAGYASESVLWNQGTRWLFWEIACLHVQVARLSGHSGFFGSVCRQFFPCQLRLTIAAVRESASNHSHQLYFSLSWQKYRQSEMYGEVIQSLSKWHTFLPGNAPFTNVFIGNKYYQNTSLGF